jgi:hypothetical protein
MGDNGAERLFHFECHYEASITLARRTFIGIMLTQRHEAWLTTINYLHEPNNYYTEEVIIEIGREVLKAILDKEHDNIIEYRDDEIMSLAIIYRGSDVMYRQTIYGRETGGYRGESKITVPQDIHEIFLNMLTDCQNIINEAN